MAYSFTTFRVIPASPASEAPRDLKTGKSICPHPGFLRARYRHHSCRRPLKKTSPQLPSKDSLSVSGAKVSLCGETRTERVETVKGYDFQGRYLDDGLDVALKDSRQGLTRGQLQSIHAIAKEEKTLLVFRFLPRAVQVFQGRGYVGKGRSISQHTDPGGMGASLIPLTPQEKNRDDKPVDRQLRRLIQEGEVQTRQLQLHPQQIDHLVSIGKACRSRSERPEEKGGFIEFRRPQSSRSRYRGIKREDSKYDMLLLDDQGRSSKFEVLVDARGQVITSDMDPVLLGVHQSVWNGDEDDRPCVSLSCLDTGVAEEGGGVTSSDSGLEELMDKEYGNITPRGHRIFDKINQSLGIPLIRHGPEMLNPHPRKKNLTPCLVFNPGLLRRLPSYLIINNLDELAKLLKTCCRDDLIVPPHPAWKSVRLGRRGSLMDVVINGDLPANPRRSSREESVPPNLL